MHNGEQVRLPLAAKGKKRTTELTDEEYAAALFRRLDVLDREISKRERGVSYLLSTFISPRSFHHSHNLPVFSFPLGNFSIKYIQPSKQCRRVLFAAQLSEK